MTIQENYIEYMKSTLLDLLSVHSPTGYTFDVEKRAMALIRDMGLTPRQSTKGNVIFDLGGEGNPLLLTAHIDTLGLMVRAIKSNGRLRYTPLNGYCNMYAATENVTIFTRSGKEYTGTIQPVKSAVHVWGDIDKKVESDEDMEIVIDEKVNSEDDVKALGIETGDIIAYDCRSVITPSGYIKSRHLDDKISCAVLMGLAKMAVDGQITFNRKVSIMFTVHEEVGHGGAAGIPEDVREVIAVDMGVIGDDLTCDEHMVSICAKDSSGPYQYHLVSRLIHAAKDADAEYSVDIYPRYGSDVDGSLYAGYDILHGLIGPGIASSHGYERGHVDGMVNTLKLLTKYLKS